MEKNLIPPFALYCTTLYNNHELVSLQQSYCRCLSACKKQHQHRIFDFSFGHCALNSSNIDVDRMSHIERSDRAGRQGQGQGQGQRRKQHRWSVPGHFHNDGRLVKVERLENITMKES